MIGVIEVYNYLKDYCNKDQKGFVTPEVFNSFAALAQQQVYNSMFASMGEALNMRRKGVDPAREKSFVRQLEEDMAYYTKRELLENSDSSEDSMLFDKPRDLSKISSISLTDRERTSVEVLLNPEKADRILSSNLSTPTKSFPVALIGDKIELFPSVISSIYLTYYRQPRSVFATSTVGGGQMGDIDSMSTPTYAANQFGGIEIAIPINCRNFDLPEHYKSKLTYEMAKLIGISLRDDFLINKTAS
tara:strand:+ start:1709 stop:2446 length:738 start_codon:yes stop_codon:yes gene_type:complete